MQQLSNQQISQRENSEKKSIYGVIRWIGILPSTSILMVGVEVEDELPHHSIEDGAINGVRLFSCPQGRALFVEPEQCTVDRRFLDFEPTTSTQTLLENERQAADNFGHIDCPKIAGSVQPLSMWFPIFLDQLKRHVVFIYFILFLEFVKLRELENVSGKFKGIQGHYNSCYLDATLFAMFTFTCVFDSLLFRPYEKEVYIYIELTC